MIEYFAIEPRPQRLLARVVDVAQLTDDKFGPYDVLFDALDESAVVDDVSQLPPSDKTIGLYSLIRLRSKPRHFLRILGLELPSPGAWFELELTPEKRDPALLCQQAQLTPRGYTGLVRTYLLSGEQVLRGDGDGPDREGGFPRSLGAAVSHSASTRRALAISMTTMLQGRADRSTIATILAPMPNATTILVRDVGQGSFVTLMAGANQSIIHIDAGWPLPFNRSTEPRGFNWPAGSAPVLLSHWDFDHLLSFYRFPLMQARVWIVPAQPLGPGAARVAQILADNDRLLVWNGGPMAIPTGNIWQCGGPLSSSNDTGLAISVRLASGRTVLLPGDADYGQMGILGAYDAILASHHGANFFGTPPRPTVRNARAAVSVGHGNKYKHPSQTAVDSYRALGWRVVATSGYPGTNRGDVQLA